MANKSQFPVSPDPRILSRNLTKFLEELRADLRRRREDGEVGEEDIKKYVESIFLVLLEFYTGWKFFPIDFSTLAKQQSLNTPAGLRNSYSLWNPQYEKQRKQPSSWFSELFPNEDMLEKLRLYSLESDSMEKEVQIEKSQALEKFKECAKRYISANDVSETTSFVHDIFVAHQKGVSFVEIEEAVQQETQALQKEVAIFRSKPEKAIQPPDLSDIPLWRGRKLDGSALDYLKIHYGQYLGAEQNSVFQDQIRSHDPRLIKGLHNQLREEGKGRKVRDFVKTRSARLDRELEGVSIADLRRSPRLAGTLYSREKRAAKAKPVPSHSVTRK